MKMIIEGMATEEIPGDGDLPIAWCINCESERVLMEMGTGVVICEDCGCVFSKDRMVAPWAPYGWVNYD